MKEGKRVNPYGRKTPLMKVIKMAYLCTFWEFMYSIRLVAIVYLRNDTQLFALRR